jgi:hypothetical protein
MEPEHSQQPPPGASQEADPEPSTSYESASEPSSDQESVYQESLDASWHSSELDERGQEEEQEQGQPFNFDRAATSRHAYLGGKQCCAAPSAGNWLSSFQTCYATCMRTPPCPARVALLPEVNAYHWVTDCPAQTTWRTW